MKILRVKTQAKIKKTGVVSLLTNSLPFDRKYRISAVLITKRIGIVKNLLIEDRPREKRINSTM
jgi:hypothetical protein